MEIFARVEELIGGKERGGIKGMLGIDGNIGIGSHELPAIELPVLRSRNGGTAGDDQGPVGIDAVVLIFRILGIRGEAAAIFVLGFMIGQVDHVNALGVQSLSPLGVEDQLLLNPGSAVVLVRVLIAGIREIRVLVIMQQIGAAVAVVHGLGRNGGGEVEGHRAFGIQIPAHQGVAVALTVDLDAVANQAIVIHTEVLFLGAVVPDDNILPVYLGPLIEGLVVGQVGVQEDAVLGLRELGVDPSAAHVHALFVEDEGLGAGLVLEPAAEGIALDRGGGDHVVRVFCEILLVFDAVDLVKLHALILRHRNRLLIAVLEGAIEVGQIIAVS